MKLKLVKPMTFWLGLSHPQLYHNWQKGCGHLCPFTLKSMAWTNMPLFAPIKGFRRYNLQCVGMHSLP